MNEIAINQFLVLVLQCVIVGSLLLFLFKLRIYFGLSLLFTALGVFQFLHTFLIAALYIEIFPGFLVLPGSIVLFNGSLFAILLIYVREDALETRKVVYALICSNLVLTILLVIFSWTILGHHIVNVFNLPKDFFILSFQLTVISTIVLLIDVFVIIFIFETISRYISILFFQIFFTMVLVVSIDSLFFSLGIFTGSMLFKQSLISSLVANLFSIFIYSLIFWIYLKFLDNKLMIFNSKIKPLNDIFNKLSYRQKYEQVTFEKLNNSIEFQKTEIRLNTLFKSMIQGVTYQNADGKIIDANPAAERILGLTILQMQGKTSMDPNWKTIHEDGSDFKGETHPSMLALKMGIPINNIIMGVFNSITKDYRWLKVNAIPQFRNSFSKPYQVFTTFEDITNERNSQRVLNELYTKYQNIIHTANIGIVEMDIQGNYTFVNPSWEKMFGYSSSEALGKNKDLISQRNQSKNILFNKLILGEISNYQIERKYVAKNGKHVWCDLYVTANKDSHGNLKSLVAVMVDITASKKAVNEVKGSEIKLRKLLNSLDSGVVVHAPDTSILYHNNKASEILNLRYDQLIGKHVFDYPWNFLNKDKSLLPLEDYPINKILNTKQAIKNMVIGYEHSDTITWVLLNGLPILNENLDVTEVIISFIDITESLKANSKIAESEEKYKNIVENSHNLIWTIDKIGNFTFLNKSSKFIFGYKPEELIGKSFFSYIPELQIQKDKTTFFDNHNNKEILNYESQLIHKEGHIIHLLTNARILFNETRNFIGITGISKDVTEQKNKEYELKASEERFRNIVEGAPDPIFIQVNKCFVYLNKLAVQLFGAKEEKELLGKSVMDYFHPDFHKIALERIKKLNIDRVMVHEPFEQILIQLNGNEVWVETKGEPIFYNGEHGGLVFIRNISARKNDEIKMKQYKNSLRKLTTELMLTEEKEKKKIAANIHDHLSQSLVISKMKLQDIWKEMEVSDKKNEIGNIIKHISEALENTRKITYDLSPPVLYELGLIEAIHWLTEKIEDQNKIKVKFDSDFNEIKLPEPKLILIYRAIQEIMNNAIKHSGANQINLFFTNYELGLLIIIKDEGNGFDKSLLNSRIPLNSGFGLFAVRERIENLEGKFIIDSTPGLGTEVKIYIPISSNKLL